MPTTITSEDRVHNETKRTAQEAPNEVIEAINVALSTQQKFVPFTDSDGKTFSVEASSVVDIAEAA